MSPTITEYIAKFRATKNIYYLAKAIALTVSQRRVTELAYGGYCSVLFPPSKVKPWCFEFTIDDILPHRLFNYTRAELIGMFGKRFRIADLPQDFEKARQQSIICDDHKLIIGEYGENSARIAFITHNTCVINDYYNSISGVRHIHSLLKYDVDKILVSTGDTRKVLDLWSSSPAFEKRIKKHFAGYTAALLMNDNCYFGTDFSSRPNYIEMLHGQKFFFPQKAYHFGVAAFYPLEDRYIVSVNADMPNFSERKTISIFDTKSAEFVFCEDLDFCETTHKHPHSLVY